MSISYKKILEKELLEVQRSIEEKGKKPTLLLHACCGPCSSYVLEYLLSFFTIRVFFYNPNIHPEAEYTRRKDELEKFIKEFKKNNAIEKELLLVCEKTYNPEDYFFATKVKTDETLQKEGEKGERCKRCYEFRMKKAFDYAVKNNFDYMTTTLSISPHKDAEKINAIGKDLGKLVDKPRFLFADFKKKAGFKRSLELSEKYGLYRQDYCGCIYSIKK